MNNCNYFKLESDMQPVFFTCAFILNPCNADGEKVLKKSVTIRVENEQASTFCLLEVL